VEAMVEICDLKSSQKPPFTISWLSSAFALCDAKSSEICSELTPVWAKVEAALSIDH
jgi:hypothetical protein